MKFTRSLIVAMIVLQGPVVSIALENAAFAGETETQFWTYKYLDGTFTRGQKTQYALALSDGTKVDLDLKAYNLEHLFKVGKQVKVGGPQKSASTAARTPYIEVENIETLSQETSLSGTMISLQASGGEPFTALELDNGHFVRIDLRTHQKENAFSSGMIALVEGNYRTVEGLTSLPRKSFVVEQIAIP
ncbi:MAG TPA: hypothetical protein VE954_19315 [Oligoflexus sp.]|uniref:hypothetical protein n=1 Tax=Oligoflexus sp. TaxID=1971216 RepID=UPI002D4950C9|nr:hypothetical protein [Oligoflexus sp.]HYX35251.1 hypothetical protein [Oligoflexus sp.]